MNEEEANTVMVGWITRPELGIVQCDVVSRFSAAGEPHAVRTVQWACGAVSPVCWCHSQERYVFVERIPVVEKFSSDRSILELEGCGEVIWAGVDAKAYVDDLRDEWSAM